MRYARASLTALILSSSSWDGIALADGGRVQLSQRCDDYRITVFTSPNPLRSGPVDVSVFIHDAATGRTVPDCDVMIELTPRGAQQRAIRTAATTDAATNKLFQAAVVELASTGWWDVRVECAPRSSNNRFAVQFAMEVGPPLPQWVSLWLWMGWPVLAVLLFATHRMLVARRQGA